MSAILTLWRAGKVSQYTTHACFNFYLKGKRCKDPMHGSIKQHLFDWSCAGASPASTIYLNLNHQPSVSSSMPSKSSVDGPLSAILEHKAAAKSWAQNWSKLNNSLAVISLLTPGRYHQNVDGFCSWCDLQFRIETISSAGWKNAMYMVSKYWW